MYNSKHTHHKIVMRAEMVEVWIQYLVLLLKFDFWRTPTRTRPSWLDLHDSTFMTRPSWLDLHDSTFMTRPSWLDLHDSTFMTRPSWLDLHDSTFMTRPSWLDLHDSTFMTRPSWLKTRTWIQGLRTLLLGLIQCLYGVSRIVRKKRNRTITTWGEFLVQVKCSFSS